MNLEKIREELEKQGEVTELKEDKDNFIISVSGVEITNRVVLDFISLYLEEIKDFYRGVLLLNFEGHAIKAIFTNDAKYIEETEE